MLFTTSRKPGSKTRAFARDLSYSLPSASYLSRGKSSLPALIEKANYEGHKFLLVVMETQGNPSQIRGIKLGEDWVYAFEAQIKVAKIRKELGKSKAKAKELEIKARGNVLKLLKLLGLDSEKEANMRLEEKQGLIKFFLEKKEIGPRFKVEAVKFEL